MLVEDGFGDDEIAVAGHEFFSGGGHEFEFFVPDVIAAVGGEEFAVAIVDACEGDTILGFESIENGIGVFGVLKGQ